MSEIIKVKYSLVSVYLAGALVGYDQYEDKKTTSLKKNILRLIDKAIYEYNEAVEAINAEINENNRSYEDMMKNGTRMHTHLIINHFENCFNSLNRVFKLYEKIRRNKDAPKIEELLERLAGLYESHIRDMRNTVEHIDDEIQDDRIADNETIALFVDESYLIVKIAGIEIKIEDLKKTISRFYEIGLVIASHNKIE